MRYSRDFMFRTPFSSRILIHKHFIGSVLDSSSQNLCRLGQGIDDTNRKRIGSREPEKEEPAFRSASSQRIVFRKGGGRTI